MLSINLLPQQFKDRLQSERFLSSINKILYPFIIIIFILLFAAGYGIYYLSSSNNQHDSQIQQKTSDLNQYADAKKNLDLINSNLTIIKQLEAYQVDWPQIFDQMAKSLPNKLQLTVLNIDVVNNGSVEISGVCDSIDTALNFQKKLEDSPNYQNVVFISSDKTDSSINFKLSAKLEKVQVPQAQQAQPQTNQNQ